MPAVAGSSSRRLASCALWLTRIGLDHRDVEPGGPAPGAAQASAAPGDRNLDEAAASHAAHQITAALGCGARSGVDLAALVTAPRERTDGAGGFFATRSMDARRWSRSGQDTRPLDLTRDMG